MQMQTKWRITAGITISCAGLMAVMSTELKFLRESLLYISIYWFIFLMLFMVSLFIVWLDIRYIKMQYAIGKRALFGQTLGSESFRKDLIERSKNKKDNSQD